MYSYNYENTFDLMGHLKESWKSSLSAEILALTNLPSHPFLHTSTQSLELAPAPLSHLLSQMPCNLGSRILSIGKYGLQDRCLSLEVLSLLRLSKE